jgi:hypothetical protein
VNKRLGDFAVRQEESENLAMMQELDAARYEIKDLHRSLANRDKAISDLEKALGIHERLSRADRIPGWLTKDPRVGASSRTGIWFAMLSDLHLDEVVTGNEVMGINQYNREIAEMRLHNIANGIVKVAFDYHSGVSVDGLVLPLAGDMFAGIIHDELRRTNAAPILDTLDHWIDPMVQIIEMLAEAFGSVHVPVVVGNHGRYDRKPIAKMRARENFDWFFAKAIARAVRDRGIRNVTFDISDSPDVIVKTYGKTTLITHGDQARGGAGWGGVFSPIMRLDEKKSRRMAQVNLPYDYIAIGHWHQLTFMPRGVVNGSLVGYDEYAFLNNFGYEVPQQAMWLMTPEHGRTFTAPVFCQDPVAEGWGISG